MAFDKIKMLGATAPSNSSGDLVSSSPITSYTPSSKPPGRFEKFDRKVDIFVENTSVVIGVITFILIWIYMILWHIVIGTLFGWIPALIAAYVIGLSWPFILAAIIFGVIYLFTRS